MDSQNSVPRDLNGLFWPTQKWRTLFGYGALIKMLCCLLMQWTETWNAKTWSNWLCLTLGICIKIYFLSILYHHHLQELLFYCNITGSPYVERPLLNIIKLLFLFILSYYNVRCWFLQSLEALTARDFHTQIYFVSSSYS